MPDTEKEKLARMDQPVCRLLSKVEAFEVNQGFYVGRGPATHNRTSHFA